MENARLRTVEEELLGVSRVGDVEGWEIPSIYLEVLRGGPIEAAGRRRDPQREGRALARACSWPTSSTATRTARPATRRPAATSPALPAPTHGTAATTRRSSAWTTRSRPRRRCGTRSGGPRSAPAARARGRARGAGRRGGRRGSGRNFGGRAPAVRAGAATSRTGAAGRSGRRRRRRPGTRPSDRWTDERLARGAGTDAAAARSLGGGGGGMAGRGGGRRWARGHRLDRGREAARAPPRRSRRRPRGHARGLAPARAAARHGAGAPAPGGGPPAARGAPGGPDPAPFGVPRRPARASVGVVAAVHAPDGVREVRDPEHARALEDQRSAGRPEAQVRVRAVPARA